MAEHWKSTPRFWCKQCKIFIRDTPFEKTQHEANPKHQGNLRRFLNSIHKDTEQKQRDSQRAKSEVERLRQVVGGGSTAEQGGAALPAKRNAPPAPKPVQRPATLEDRKKQMAQLAAMGVAIPEEYRADLALAGEWQTISETRVEPQLGLEGPSKSIGVRKRKLEEEEEDRDEAEPETIVNKGWGSRTKQYPGAQDDGDLDDLLASTQGIRKTKTFTPKAELVEPDINPEQPTNTTKKEDATPKSEAQEIDQSGAIKTEEPDSASIPVTEKQQSPDAASSVVFKKRKPKPMKK